MSKELRALERMENILKANCHHYKQDVGYIREALQRLEAIEKAKPSEALEWLENKCYVESPQDEKFEECCSTIKQALLKAQKQEKVLSIIFEKNVSIFWVRECKNVEEYNYNIPDYLQLTKEEFDLLKRLLDEKDN